jgi:hypothetical protein
MSLPILFDQEPEIAIHLTLDEIQNNLKVIYKFMEEPCCLDHHDGGLQLIGRFVNAEITLKLMKGDYQE